MEYAIASFAVFGLAVGGMALGVIFSNKPIRGSCGGLKNIMGDDCEICGKKDQCKRRLAAKGLVAKDSLE